MGIFDKLLGKKFEKPVNEYRSTKVLQTDSQWFGQGMQTYAFGRFSEALQCFENALKINPNNIDALIGKGHALTQLGRYQEAVSTYNEVINSWPDAPSADRMIWYNKGLAYYNLGQ